MSQPWIAGIIASIFALACSGSVAAQDSGQKLPTAEDFAKDNKLFIKFARKALKWDEPAEPFKIAGPLYFVGTRGLSSY